MAAAKTAEELLKALPASVNAENYAAAKSAIIAARATYDALSEDARALITSYAKLTAAESALKTYEDSLNSKGGCSNTVAYSALGVSLALVLAAGVIAFARKKKD